VTHSIILLVTDLVGKRRVCTMATARRPSTWTADNARKFLHDVMRAIEAHGIYRVSFDPGVPGPLCVLTVEADSAIATATLPSLSEVGRIALERMTFQVPWRRPQVGRD
jgi:hypothetical protein